MDILDGDFFENLADFTYGDIYSKQHNPAQVNIDTIRDKNKRTPILFINTERLGLLLMVVAQYKKDVIIISHNSDITISDSLLENNLPPNILRLWCQNYNGNNHDRIKPLPIGFERKRWFPNEKKNDVLDKYSNMILEKEHLVYMNFNIKTNNNRQIWFNELKDKDFIHSEMLGNGNGFENYIQKVKKSHFVLSPEGNGIDCHRNWECLKVGSIPIISKSNFANNIFTGLPVMMIDDVKDITRERLLEFVNSNDTNTNLDKLRCDYWKKLIMKDVKEY